MGNQDSKSAPMPTPASHELPKLDVEPEAKCTSGHYLDTGADGDTMDTTSTHPSDPSTHSSQMQDPYLTELTELLDKLCATQQTSSEDEQPQQGAESLGNTRAFHWDVLLWQLYLEGQYRDDQQGMESEC